MMIYAEKKNVWQGSIFDAPSYLWVWAGKCVSVGCKCGSERAAEPEKQGAESEICACVKKNPGGVNILVFSEPL